MNSSGLVLLAVSVWLLMPHPEADAKLERKVSAYANHASVWVFAGLAAYMTVTDFSTIVILIPACTMSPTRRSPSSRRRSWWPS